jgi:hypothetical protein
LGLGLTDLNNVEGCLHRTDSLVFLMFGSFALTFLVHGNDPSNIDTLGLKGSTPFPFFSFFFTNPHLTLLNLYTCKSSLYRHHILCIHHHLPTILIKMKFTIALIAVMAQVASATFGHQFPKPPVPAPAPACGTTTITEQCKTATK